MPTVISRPCSAPAIAGADRRRRSAAASRTRWSAANEPMIASGSRRAISAAARPIAAHESRGDGSTSRFSSGRSGSWRATAAAWADAGHHVGAAPAADSGASRSTVACSSDAAGPVSACRNFGWPARDSGHSRVPLPPAGMTAYSAAGSHHAHHARPAYGPRRRPDQSPDLRHMVRTWRQPATARAHAARCTSALESQVNSLARASPAAARASRRGSSSSSAPRSRAISSGSGPV